MNTIHPTAIIGDDVTLGDGNVVGPHVVLYGPLVVGDGNWFGPGVVVGTPPEVRGEPHTAQWVEPGRSAGTRIGSRNVFREHALVHQGWHETTVVGDDCFIMNAVYIAHDTVVEDGVTIASSVAMGGHVVVGAGANIGLGAAVHQRRVIAPGAMVGMGAVVTRDVPPFAKVYGNPARLRGANVVGMRRRGVDEDVAQALDARYQGGEVPGADQVAGPAREQFVWWERRVPAGA